MREWELIALQLIFAIAAIYCLFVDKVMIGLYYAIGAWSITLIITIRHEASHIRDAIDNYLDQYIHYRRTERIDEDRA